MQCQIDGIAVRAKAFFAARDDVLRAAVPLAELLSSVDQRDARVIDFVDAVDRLEKLEGAS